MSVAGSHVRCLASHGGIGRSILPLYKDRSLLPGKSGIAVAGRGVSVAGVAVDIVEVEPTVAVDAVAMVVVERSWVAVSAPVAVAVVISFLLCPLSVASRVAVAGPVAAVAW